jgi:hypothetical protein
MKFERLSAFIQSDGILKIHLALLQPGDDGFQLLESAFKAQFFDGLAGIFGLWGRNGGTPAFLLVSDAPRNSKSP